jgi:hypothetical protein
MGVGSKFYNIWTCTNCDYQESTIQAPIKIEPLPGVKKSQIEERWCFDCSGIRRCFLGKGFDYINKNQKLISGFLFGGNDIDSIKARIEVLKRNIKYNPFYWFTSDFKEIKKLEIKLIEAINQEKLLAELRDEAKLFYENNPTKPKCLICGSLNVSERHWEADKHICGGSFKCENSDTRYSVRSYELIQYDSIGNTLKSVVNL